MKSPPSMAAVGTVKVPLISLRCVVRSKFSKKKSFFLLVRMLGM